MSKLILISLPEECYFYSVHDTKCIKFLHKAKRKSVTLLIPYLCFSVPAYVFWFVSEKSSSGVSFVKPLIGTFVAIRNSDWTLHTGTLWFVVCLLVTEILFYVLYILTKGHYFKLFICLVACSVIGFIFNSFTNRALPLNIDAALIVVVFYGLGNYFKQKEELFNKFFNFKLFFVALLFGFTGFLNVKVDIFSNIYGNSFFYISALAGTLILIKIAKIISHQKILEYIGRNSLVLLVAHPLICNIFRRTITFPEGLPVLKSIMYGTVYVILGLLISVPIIYVINKFFPFMLGKRINYFALFRDKSKTNDLQQHA